MPPKKKNAGSEGPIKVRLGRPKNNVKIGVLGMPNVGKSSTFNLMANLSIPAENYPFCTIDPNVARVIVPDSRYDWLCNLFKPKSEVPAVLNVTDIAGLVKGASEGAGLGNAFLSHVSAVDAMFHVCRAFKDKEIEHVEGDVDPVRDLATISNELRLKDLAQVKGLIAPLMKGAGRKADKVKKFQFECLEKFQAHLEAGKDIRYGDWSPTEVEFLNELQLLSAKPIVFLVNISAKNFRTKKNKWLMPIKQWVKDNSPESPVIPYSVTWEAEFAAMDEEQKKAECEEHKVQSMMPRMIRSGYSALGLINFFTCGKDEVRAWTVREGATAPQAAGVIHGDLEKTFVMSETQSYDDLVEHGSEAAVKAAGRLRMEGKNYIVKDGDICFFKAGAGRSK